MKRAHQAGDQANDRDPVGIEIAAAYLAADPDQVNGHVGWCNGWAIHAETITNPDAPYSNPSESGWLAREIFTHGQRTTRDADAWPWDPTRPVAGQFYEWASKALAARANAKPARRGRRSRR